MLSGLNGDEELSWDPADPLASSSSSSDDPFCECPGPPPPPRFLIPPPPAPPAAPGCRGPPGAPHPLQFCQAEPVGAEFTQTAFPSLPVIAVCSSVVLVAVLVASFLLWKHKRKVQNFLPCKSHHQGRCDMGGASGITYDDVLINHHPTRLPNHLNPDTNTLTPIELLDVKYGNYVQSHADPLTRTNFTLPQTKNNNNQPNSQQQQQTMTAGERPRQRHRNGRSQQQGQQQNQQQQPKKKEHHQFHPIYEEVSATSDDNKPGRSYDSDIEDSEVEGRTVVSEDEFAEDELSVAGEYPPNSEDRSQPCSATSSLQGSTGGDLYPDVVTGSSERFCSDGSPAQDGRTLKTNFRGVEGAPGAQGKMTHSLERNKDGHPSNSFQAKQNYYLNKSMLGPDFTYPEGAASSPPEPVDPQDAYAGARTLGGPSLNFIPAMSLYNPHLIPGGARIPEALLRELTFRGGPVAPMSSRSLPVPPSCRAGGSGGVVFTVEAPPYPAPPPMPAPMSRTRSGSATEFTYPSYPHTLGGGRAPTPPPPENIYASIEDVGPFTIDGSRHGARGGPFGPRKGSLDLRNTFGRARAAPKPAGTDKFQANNVPSRHPGEEAGPYGDLRPALYDSRTACS